MVGVDARDERLDLRRVGVIADDADPGAAAGAGLRRGVLHGAGHVVGTRARARGAPADVDGGAGLPEDGGDGGAGPAAGAGDEGDAVGEVGHARHHRAPRGACSDAPGGPPLSPLGAIVECHARSAGHRAGAPAPGARAALRQARRPARAPPAGQGLAPRPRAARASQFEHERHLKAINEAADQLDLAGRGLARRPGVAQRGQGQRAAATRKARAEEGRRAYEAEQRAREHAADRPSTTRSARACPTTRSCTATRAA